MPSKNEIDTIRKENEDGFNEDARATVELLLSSGYPMKWLYVFELLQNALDAGADRVRFTTSTGGLVFEHNGTEALGLRHVRALCRVGRSTKGLGAVGFMGIGFKSVFQRYRCARVSGFGWQFRFDIGVVEGAKGSRIPRYFDAVLRIGTTRSKYRPSRGPRGSNCQSPSNRVFLRPTTFATSSAPKTRHPSQSSG